MNKKLHRIVTLLITMALIIGLFAGCGGKEDQQANDKTSEEQQSDNTDQNTEESSEDTAGGKITDEPVTLTYWSALNGNVSQTATNYGDTPLYQEMEKRTC